MAAHDGANARGTGTLERVCAILAQYVEAPPGNIGPASTPESTPGWDSVANLHLMASIEDEFGVTVGTRDAMKLRSVGDIVRFLDARRGGGGAG